RQRLGWVEPGELDLGVVADGVGPAVRAVLLDLLLPRGPRRRVNERQVEQAAGGRELAGDRGEPPTGEALDLLGEGAALGGGDVHLVAGHAAVRVLVGAAADGNERE